MSEEYCKEIIIELVKNMTDGKLLESLYYIIQKMAGREF